MIDIAITGHRPQHSPFGWDHNTPAAHSATERLMREFRHTDDLGFVHVGGALGFDWLAARAAFKTRTPYIVHLPSASPEQHAARWPGHTKAAFAALVSHATEILTYTDEGTWAGNAHARNQAMVDAASSTNGRIVAWWDGRGTGGTAGTLRYVASLGLSHAVLNLHPTCRTPVSGLVTAWPQAPDEDTVCARCGGGLPAGVAVTAFAPLGQWFAQDDDTVYFHPDDDPCDGISATTPRTITERASSWR